ncbi:ATP-binding cassette domain-containing protein [Spelaeicoccus albus]|uniref:ABC-type uncharacterized transport system YnjBCD ATPase subunit n=1 Tax=Spelaeicoccus albus TaxID=1280376 RepID=A0A7Z0CZI2_9MICO|nr:hypothetical protein [Spelaeicoccus albus]NYI66356.1 ABC-type uncharacterized transport system YnjBCD ATPase subunit [Spelaeicoccus albus]
MTTDSDRPGTRGPGSDGGPDAASGLVARLPLTSGSSLDITVRPGEVFALFGPSGDELAELLRLAARTLTTRTPPAGCRVFLDGAPGPAGRGDVLMLERDGTRYPASRLAAAMTRVRSSSHGKARTADALDRALASRPRVLLLDCPLAVLGDAPDSPPADALRAALTGFPGCVVMTTDDAGVAESADRIAVIDDGAAQIGTPAEVRAHPRSTYAARLADVNFFTGLARGGRLSIGHSSISAPTELKGRVLITVPPRAVTVYPDEPGGADRDVFEARIAHLAGGRRAEGSTVPEGRTLRLGLSPVDPERGLELTALASAQIPWTLGQRVFARVDTSQLSASYFSD